MGDTGALYQWKFVSSCREQVWQKSWLTKNKTKQMIWFHHLNQKVNYELVDVCVVLWVCVLIVCGR